jgi:hypothetical protein
MGDSDDFPAAGNEEFSSLGHRGIVSGAVRTLSSAALEYIKALDARQHDSSRRDARMNDAQPSIPQQAD